jgi:hypothetical protein
MFTQVYFHKTRAAYDIHVREAMRTLLPGGRFPEPTDTGIVEFLKWDDWRVLGMLADGKGGEHGARLSTRNHYRMVVETPEVASKEDLVLFEEAKQKLGELAEESRADKNWYKTGNVDISVVSDLTPGKVFPLSERSSVIKGMKANNQVRLYVRPEDREKAQTLLNRQ